MNRQIPLTGTLVLALAALAVPADARSDSPPFAAEVESCVAAVNAHLDLGEATRVRHFVSDADRTGLGYALTIETSVFLVHGPETVEKRYEAHCIARGRNAPSTFRIEEIGA